MEIGACEQAGGIAVGIYSRGIFWERLSQKMAMDSPLTNELIRELRKKFALDWKGIHGAPHWARVRQNGLLLCGVTGASSRVIEAFAFVHDSCRLDDGFDPDHGMRAAGYARWLVKEKKLPLSAKELDLLVRACEGHSRGGVSGDITVATCWDADRLDLGRVGVMPDPNRLCTVQAQTREIIYWAYRRSIQ